MQIELETGLTSRHCGAKCAATELAQGAVAAEALTVGNLVSIGVFCPAACGIG